VKTARAGFGVKKSSVSKNFVQASAEQLQKFDQRRFDEVTFAAIFIDGVAFGGEVMVVALGVDEAGRKHVLGLRQGETENAEVVKELVRVRRPNWIIKTRRTASKRSAKMSGKTVLLFEKSAKRNFVTQSSRSQGCEKPIPNKGDWAVFPLIRWSWISNVVIASFQCCDRCSMCIPTRLGHRKCLIW
jgi:hypothetical protein